MMKRIISILILLASCVISQGQTTHIIGCIGCVDSNRGNTSILGGLRIMTVPYKAPTTDSVLCRDIYGNIYRTKVSSGSNYTATYPILINGTVISADTGRSAAQLITGGSLNKVRDSVAAYAATKQSTISVNAPILLSSNTISADTGRASAKLVTGGTLNSVRDSITSHFPASVTSGYGLTGTTTFNADTTVLQKKLTSGGRNTYVGSLGYFDSVNQLTLTKLKVTGADTLANTFISGVGTTNIELAVTKSDATSARIQVQNSTTGYLASNGFQFATASGDGYLWNFYAGAIHIATSNTERMTIFSGGGVGIGSSTQAGSSKLGIPIAPDANANYGLVSLGTGGFGGSAGNFSGSSAGTYLAINQPNGGTADFANWQVNGVSAFKVNKDGNTTVYALTSSNGITGYNITANGNLVAGNSLTCNNLTNLKGTLVTQYVAKTANYTIGLFDHTINCTSGSFTVTLPDATLYTAEYYIKNTGGGTITLATTSSQTIDGASTQTVTNGMIVQSNGANWIIISKY